jgi:hypothetical protein
MNQLCAVLSVALCLVVKSQAGGAFETLFTACSHGHLGALCEPCGNGREGYVSIAGALDGRCYKLFGQRDWTQDSANDGFYVDKTFFVRRDEAFQTCALDAAQLPNAETRENIVAIENVLAAYSDWQGNYRQFPGSALNGDPANGVWMRWVRQLYPFDDALLKADFPNWASGFDWNKLTGNENYWEGVHAKRVNRLAWYDPYSTCNAETMEEQLWRPFRPIVGGQVPYFNNNNPGNPSQPRDDTWVNGHPGIDGGITGNERATAIKTIGRSNNVNGVVNIGLGYDYGVDDYDPRWSRHAILCEICAGQDCLTDSIEENCFAG